MKLGSYELESRLAAGGMGEVWIGRHTALDRRAAIKLIRPESLGGSLSDTVLRRFELEARATSRLRSPHTIEIYDFGLTDDGSFFYAMELLDGCDLRTLVDHVGPVKAARATWLLAQVCASLEEAHRSGLIHRDIKPGNIYLCRLGLECDFVKVLDFGLVKLRDDFGADAQITREGMMQGTPAFMAPEGLTANAAIDARYDIYALGCVAYWLVTGLKVFDAEDGTAQMLAHATETPVRPSERVALPIPPEFEDVVMACLAKDPDDRPGSAAELSRALTDVVVGKAWCNEQAETWWLQHNPEEWSSAAAGTVESEPSLEATRRLPTSTPLRPASRTGVAVLPFDNLSGDPEQAFFSDGVAEGIIRELGRFRQLSVISRRASFRYRDTDASPMRIAQELEVRYVVQGSVRRLGKRIRVSVDLVDGRNGKLAWGESYDRTVDDLFEIESDVVQRIVASVAGRLEAESMTEARAKAPATMDAYECMLRGLDHYSRQGAKSTDDAIRWFERAIELDPDYAPAYAWYSCTISRKLTSLEDPLLDKITQYLARASELDPDEPEVQRLFAAVEMARGNIDKARFHQERGLALNPNNERIVCQHGELHIFLGDGERAVHYVRRAMELNPYHPPHWWGHLGRGLHMSGRYEEALAAFRRMPEPRAQEFAYMAACAAELGRESEAVGYADRLRATTPGFDVHTFVKGQFLQVEAEVERLRGQLERAGLGG